MSNDETSWALWPGWNSVRVELDAGDVDDPAAIQQRMTEQAIDNALDAELGD